MANPTEAKNEKRTTWEFDPKHTLAEFSAKHMMFTSVKGRFTGVRGTLVTDEEDPTRSTAYVELETGTLTTGQDERDAHLRSPDFLDVANHPLITFQSTRVERVAEDRFTMYGDLAIRGTTREVALDVTFNGRSTSPWGQSLIAFTAETSIDRRDYGLVWNVPLEKGGLLVGNNVKILLEVEAIRG